MFKPFNFYVKQSYDIMLCLSQHLSFGVASEAKARPKLYGRPRWSRPVGSVLALGVSGVDSLESEKSPILATVEIRGAGLRVVVHRTWGLVLGFDMHTVLRINLPSNFKVNAGEDVNIKGDVPRYILEFQGPTFPLVHSFVSLLAEFKKPTVFGAVGVFVLHRAYNYRSFKKAKSTKRSMAKG